MPRLAAGPLPGARVLAVFVGLLAALLTTGWPTAAGAADDPSLDQSLDADLAVVDGTAVLDAGHVDLGPKFVDGEWTFLVHDDAARADAAASSVWRHAEQTVLHVGDAARLTVPDDPAYAHLGDGPGSSVYVVPQTQDPNVVWVGWNTQDPTVMEQVDRGVTMSMTGVEGPGSLQVYLQSGNFGAPEPLWDSRTADAQPVWVDVNTHTHANWVFSEPGVYLVHLDVSADLVDGTTVSDTRAIRFAVGDATDPATALAATPAEPAAGEPAAGEAADAQPAAAEDGSDPLVPVLIGAIVLVALLLVAGAVVVVLQGRKAKRRALAGSGEAPVDAGSPR